MTEEFFTIEGLVILLLFIATVVGIFAQRWRKPYTVGLVLVGLVLAPLEQNLAIVEELHISIGPELILGLLVPPLIFEAAFHLRYERLRRNWKTIFVLAVPGVAMTTLIVGGIVSLSGLDLGAALMFGTLVSATDPVAVIATFRTMGVPRDLQVLLEGESLFNDGTAIVVFNLVLGLVIGSQGFENFDLTSTIFEFLVVSGGGLMTGIMLGLVISLMISRITLPLIEATLTTVLAYGSYALAELLGVSGVLAVVAAGIVGGNMGRQRMSPTTNIVVTNLWEFAAFIANSFVFLVIGLEIQLSTLTQNISLILIGIGSVLLARLVVVFGFAWVDDISIKWKRIMYWGGLRGAISLALVLSLPIVNGRAQVQAMTFGVVLFTLLVQGTTMGRLVKRENLIVQKTESQTEYERRHARAVAARSAFEHLERMNKQGLLSEHIWETISPLLRQRIRALTDAIADLILKTPEVQSEELDTSWREKLRAERTTYTSLLSDGVITEESYNLLVAEVDFALANEEIGWTDLMRLPSPYNPEDFFLIAAIIQEKDAENALNALTSLGLATTRLPSTGGFLGTLNATLLIIVTAEQIETAIKSLEQSCVHRVEQIQMTDSPMLASAFTQVKIGGATLFIFDVDHYEDF